VRERDVKDVNIKMRSRFKEKEENMSGIKGEKVKGLNELRIFLALIIG